MNCREQQLFIFFLYFFFHQAISIPSTVVNVSTLGMLIAISFSSIYTQWWQLLTDKISNTAYTATRDAVTKRKAGPNRPWRGMGQLSARYITATLPAPQVLSFSFSCLPPSLLSFGLDNANNTTVDKRPSDRKALSLRIWSGLTFDQREPGTNTPECHLAKNSARERTGSPWITIATAPLRYRGRVSTTLI